MAGRADPVGFGLVASLSHPGDSVTGLANFSDILVSKQIDVLRELMLGLLRVGMLVNIGNPLHASQLNDSERAANASELTRVRVDIENPDGLDATFATLGRAHVEAFLVPPATIFLTSCQRIAELAATSRLPANYGFRDHIKAGGLMSYGRDPQESYRQAATYVDKILKGAKPADFPIEQANKIELILNLRVALALGICVPGKLLALADEVIE